MTHLALVPLLFTDFFGFRFHFLKELDQALLYLNSFLLFTGYALEDIRDVVIDLGLTLLSILNILGADALMQYFQRGIIASHLLLLLVLGLLPDANLILNMLAHAKKLVFNELLELAVLLFTFIFLLSEPLINL